MQGFRLDLRDFSRIGSDLCRPEFVLATASGELYANDERGGVTRIGPDGAMTRYTGSTPDGQRLAANGFAMLPDGSFLLAPLVGGGVYHLHRRRGHDVPAGGRWTTPVLPEFRAARPPGAASSSW